MSVESLVIFETPRLRFTKPTTPQKMSAASLTVAARKAAQLGVTRRHLRVNHLARVKELLRDEVRGVGAERFGIIVLMPASVGARTGLKVVCNQRVSLVGLGQERARRACSCRSACFASMNGLAAFANFASHASSTHSASSSASAGEVV